MTTTHTYDWNPDDVLTPEEERTLLHDIEVGVLAAAARAGELRSDATDDELAHLIAVGEQARQRYLTGNLGLVLYFANIAGRRHGRAVDDLVQEGFLGLVRALERFDPDTPVRFATYATPWVRSAINDAIHRDTGFGRHTSRGRRHLQRIQRMLEQELGREPRLDELAQRAGRSLMWVSEMMHHAPPVSLDELVVDPVAPDAESPDDQVRAWLAQALNRLPEEQRAVLARRFGLDGAPPVAIRAAAHELGMSRRHLRMVEAIALERLRHWSAAA